MLQILKNVLCSMCVGYIVYTALYFYENHCIVRFKGGILSTLDLIIILAVVGLFLSFIN